MNEFTIATFKKHSKINAQEDYYLPYSVIARSEATWRSMHLKQQLRLLSHMNTWIATSLRSSQ